MFQGTQLTFSQQAATDAETCNEYSPKIIDFLLPMQKHVKLELTETQYNLNSPIQFPTDGYFRSPDRKGQMRMKK